MRTFRATLAVAIAIVMVGVLPLGVAAQTDSVDPAGDTSDSAGEVLAITDLVYATSRAADRPTELKLSLHVAAEDEQAPMVLDAGWVVNDPRALAERGVSVFRLTTPERWSEFAVDADPAAVRTMVEAVACAVRFARGSEYGSETATLVLTGFSRHGITASHVALAGESFDRLWDDYAESAGGPPVQHDCTISEASTRVDGFVGIGGGYDAMVGYAADSPFGRDHLLEHQPDLWAMLDATVGLHPELRVRLLHGHADSIIPLGNSAAFEAVLAEAGYDVELIEFPGGHGVPFDLMVDTVMGLMP